MHSLTMTGDYQSVHINRSFILTGGLIHSLTMTGDYQSVHINSSSILSVFIFGI